MTEYRKIVGSEFETATEEYFCRELTARAYFDERRIRYFGSLKRYVFGSGFGEYNIHDREGSCYIYSTDRLQAVALELEGSIYDAVVPLSDWHTRARMITGAEENKPFWLTLTHAFETIASAEGAELSDDYLNGIAGRAITLSNINEDGQPFDSDNILHLLQPEDRLLAVGIDRRDDSNFHELTVVPVSTNLNFELGKLATDNCR